MMTCHFLPGLGSGESNISLNFAMYCVSTITTHFFDYEIG